MIGRFRQHIAEMFHLNKIYSWYISYNNKKYTDIDLIKTKHKNKPKNSNFMYNRNNYQAQELSFEYSRISRT